MIAKMLIIGLLISFTDWVSMFIQDYYNLVILRFRDDYEDEEEKQTTTSKK